MSQIIRRATLWAVTVLAAMGMRAYGAAAVSSYEVWLEHRSSLAKSPDVVRYYTFEKDAGGGPSLANAVSQQAPLTFHAGPSMVEAESLQPAAGRWPQKPAVRLDRGFLATEPFPVENKSFTVAAWLRKQGPGVHRGNDGVTNGTLLSVGVGYWDGWRLTTTYPAGTVGFEIGRPQPVNAIGVGTDPVTDDAWHHIAATWDGQRMRVFVDGVIRATKEYSGEYTPPKAGAQFRIGYAGHGFGSVVLDVDEVIVYRRALAPAEILQAAHLESPISEAAAQQMLRGEEAFEKGDYPSATAAFEQALTEAGTAAAARLRIAAALRQQAQASAAAKRLAEVVEMPGVGEGHRSTALAALVELLPASSAGAISRGVYEEIIKLPGLSAADALRARLNLARSYRDAKDFAGARRQLAAIAELPELSARERLDIYVELGHTSMEAKDYEGARKEYARIVAASDAPPAYRSHAQLRLAETFVREKNHSAAKAELAKVETLAKVPAHHIWEAAERSRELDRVQAGLPPRDPGQSRVQLPAGPKPAVTLYVAPNGSDSNPGTREAPFGSPYRAQMEIRRLKRGGLPAGGVTICLREGQYRLRQTWRLAAEDSGTPEAPIVYRACENETVLFTGGASLKDFQPVADRAVRARLDEGARDKVVEIDLRAAGITDFGQAAGEGNRPELFFNGQPMPLARWPNEGFVHVGELLGQGELKAGWGNIEGRREGIFTYDGDRPSRWNAEEDIWLFGYWYWDWADAYHRVGSIDTTKRVITIAPPYRGYGFRTGQRYYALNLLAELDAPGEWYLDRSRGKLYFWPPADMANAAVELSMLAAPMAELEGASHVALRGLTFELGRGDGIAVRGGEKCLIAGCTVRRLGQNGVIIDGGTGHGVLGCDIYTLGRGGTRVTGGNRKTLAPSGHFIENCHIYDFSRIHRTYTPAVWMDGVGHRIAHNSFHDSPHQAMRIEGNDHLVEFNEVYDVVRETDDQGGIDMWYNPTYRGNIFRYNFWHDIGGGVGLGAAGIRLDDAICGVLIYGNVFCRSSDGSFGGVQIHGGKENIVDNNLFIDCRHAVSFSPWGEKRWQETLARPDMVKKLTEDVDISRPPYATRYPDLARLGENPDVNQIWRNVAVRCGGLLTRDRGIQDVMDNHMTDEDPGFADAGKLDFSLPEGSPLYDRTGLRPIPFAEIGLYEDEFRPKLPAKHK